MIVLAVRAVVSPLRFRALYHVHETTAITAAILGVGEEELAFEAINDGGGVIHEVFVAHAKGVQRGLNQPVIRLFARCAEAPR
jgi:hypothetical protein